MNFRNFVKSIDSRSIIIGITATTVFWAVCIFLGSISLNRLFALTPWTIELVNETLTVPIPADGRNITIEGNVPERGGYLRLSFEAQLQNAMTFAKQFCQGQLYTGYDPFNAIDAGEPFTFAFPISMDSYTYFSYSPTATKSILGTRCLSSSTSRTQIQIRVDTTDTAFFTVKFENRYDCELCRFFPLTIVKPVSESPLQVLGISQEQGIYSLINSEMCIGMEMSTRAEKEKWNDLIGGKIEVLIDNQPVAMATIEKDGRLTNRISPPTTFWADEGYWQNYYCFRADSNKGLNTVIVHVISPVGRTLSYTWELMVI